MARQKKRQKKNVQAKPKAYLFYFFFGFLVLLLPVFQLPQSLDRTMIPRMLAMSVLLLITTPLIFNTRILSRWDFSIWRHKLIYIYIAFFVMTVVSAFFAFNPMESYFFIIRNMLFVTSLAFGALILANTPGWIDKLPKLYIVTAAIALLIGFIQYYTRVYLSTEELLPDGRAIIYQVIGMFSHKNFFSSALILMMPFTAFGVYKYRGGWQIAALVVSLATLLMILLLGTRSVWVGAFMGGLTASIILIAFSKRFDLDRRWRMLIFAALLTGAVSIAGIFTFGDASNEFSIPGRVQSIIDPQSQHNIHRLNIWEGSLTMIKEQPLTGVGAGNWCVHIPKLFDHRFEYLEALGWRQPHNDYVWVAAEQGIIGILLFLAAFVLVFFYQMRVIVSGKENAGKDKKVLSLLLLFGVIAYLADSFFSFPYERIGIMALLMVATASTLAIYHDIAPKGALKPARLPFLVAGLLLFSFGAYYSFGVIKMEKNMGSALIALRAGEFNQILHHAHAAKTPFRSLGPHLYPPEFLEGVAYQNLDQHKEAIDAFEKARSQAPHDIRILHLLAKNKTAMGYYDEAEALFYEIEGIFPLSASMISDIKSLVLALYQTGEYQQALDLLMIIPEWEEDEEVVRNKQALETLIEREASDQ